MDPPFLRRIRHVVRFEMPGEAVRKEIWESLLIPELPKGDIDVGFLAKQFEFSGAVIKNVVLNAVFLAASDDKPLGMEHIIKSIIREYQKNGEIGCRSKLDKYTYVYDSEAQTDV